MSLTADDRLEMIELVSRYNQTIDGRDGLAWADTFTADGIFRVERRDDVCGREALTDMVAAMGNPGARHWTTNFVIVADAQGATMTVDLAVMQGARILGTGRYINTLHQVDGRWKFALRHYLPDARA
jgi:hypothetical protein